ncbi:MAG TPA: trehalose-phosphatase [Rhizobacter sp.]|nr:trehalose-phosphatase [Rhizobacter sp.]
MLASPLPVIHANSALFFDFDGTLVDLAQRPDEVIVEPGLVRLLGTLRRSLHGALAVVSGRPIAQIDAFLAPLHLPVAGVHGAERRSAHGNIVSLVAPSLAAATVQLEALALAHPGLLLERKPGALAIHYRLAPALEALCERAMSRVCEDLPGMALIRGKKVIELKTARASKARALEAFLLEPPFVGREPMFIGDDLTDEDAFVAVQKLGGAGIKVDVGPSAARHRVASVAALHAWLHEGLVSLGEADALTPEARQA